MSDETRVLLQFLDTERDHVLGILEGLSEEQLRRPVLPSGWQQHDDRRNVQPAGQYLGADREHKNQANADQYLICRHASLRSRRVNSLFADRSLCSGWC